MLEAYTPAAIAKRIIVINTDDHAQFPKKARRVLWMLASLRLHLGSNFPLPHACPIVFRDDQVTTPHILECANI